MSLPPATKDISEHPQPGSVTSPTDRPAQEADVDRKLRFYGVIEAFRQGRMPDNRQIDDTLRYVEEHSPIDTDQLSTEGKKLIQDTRDIIETARLIVREKNADELFQRFVWHTKDVSLEGAKVRPEEVSPVERGKLVEDRKEAVHHLRAILSIILTNSEVRKLLSDFSVVGRDLLAKGAVKAAEALRPTEEELAKVGEAAPQGEFTTREDHKGRTEEAPAGDAEHELKEEIPTSDIVQTGKEAVQQISTGVTVQTTEVREEGDIEGVSSGASEETEKKRGFKEHVRAFRDNIAERIPGNQKDRAREQLDRGRKYLSEEYFPEERRDQFIYRAKKVIIECQKHDDYQDAFKWLLSVAEDYANHVMSVSGHGKERGEAVISDPALRQATSELRELLERFANGKSMDTVFDAADALIDDARRDEGFRDWIKRFYAYIRKTLLEAGYILEEECNREGHEIRESGRKYWDEKYRGHIDMLFNAIGDWFSAMAEDPLNKRFGEDWARLTRNLLFDSEGSLKLKPELWSDIRKVIVPTLNGIQVGYIPIPRVEYTDDTLDLVVENLTLQGRNLFPNIISIEAHNYMKFSPYDTISDEHHHEFTLTFAQIQADMREVAFYFRKKSGFPRVADSGIADVLIGGSGLTATAHLVSANKDRSSVFKVRNVHVKVDSLKFSIRDSKHDLLYKTLKPLATALVKRQIQKAIAGGISTGLEYLDGQLVAVRDHMEEAKAKSDTTRTQALQDLFKRRKEETQSVKTSESKAQFKVVHNRRASIIEAGTPAGWVNRVTEREEKATTGDDWRSEAFSVVG